MTGPQIIIPPAGAVACRNCAAWSPWDHVTVGQAGPNGFVVVGRKPTGQCRAATPTIDPDAIGPENATWPVVAADHWCRQFEARGEQGEAA